MCGRICCALSAPTYEAAASYYDENNNEYNKPSFIPFNGKTFTPSTNISPSEVIPVLVWDKIKKCPVIKPMIWGLTSRTTGNAKNRLISAHNCRLENLLNSPFYSDSIKENRRCVILCEGYYEWETLFGKHKDPIFIYAMQPRKMKAEEESHWLGGEWSKSAGWFGPSLTCLAGIYSSFENSILECKGIPSASIITMNSSKSFRRIHHRMPAILSTHEQVKDWLNVEGLGMVEAISKLKPSEFVAWHKVSSEVNNARNKTSNCNKPVDISKLGGRQTSLTSFFKKPKKDEDNSPRSTP